jgi:hypothetical protein
LLSEVDERCGVASGYTPHAVRADEFAGEIGDGPDEDWEFRRVSGDKRFTDLVTRRYRGRLGYTTLGYLDLLSSISAYRILDPGQRDAALAGVAGVLDARGGGIDLVVVTDLTLVRRV